MKKINYIFLVFLMLSSFKCYKDDREDCHRRIRLFNSSDSYIYIDYSFDYPDTIPGYPKTSTPKALMANSYGHKTAPDEINDQGVRTTGCWEREIRSTWIPSDTLIVFVFDADFLEQYLDYKILRRYDLSLDDLQRIEWMLVYPPDESMRHIKMYPPYGSN